MDGVLNCTASKMASQQLRRPILTNSEECAGQFRTKIAEARDTHVMLPPRGSIEAIDVAATEKVVAASKKSFDNHGNVFLIMSYHVRFL